MEAPQSLTPDQLDERIAIAFLERFSVDAAAGRRRGLADYLASFPGHEARVATEWLMAAGHAPASPDAEAPVPPGGSPAESIGPYRLLHELGRGGQGVVYLAEDARVGRKVALKVLARELASLSGQAALRFRREAEAIARLDHPHIATVFEVGESAGVAFLAMRYVAGGSVQQQLAARLAQGLGPPAGREEIAQVVRLVERAARALAAAHRAGILHRDVKPANLLLAGRDDPVLVDFGLATDEAGTTPTITVPGAVLGTLCYLPPERLAGAAADPRSDVYGVGAVLFELLTLARPFQAATTAAELHAIAHAPPPDVRHGNPAVGRDLAVVVATALAREPSERYQTAAAFADDLARVLAHEPIEARPAGLGTRLVRFAQREPALAFSLAVLLVVLLAGLATTTWLWRNERRALADVTRLADLKLARELRDRDAGLWPARPERAAAMRVWIDDARALEQRMPGHVELLGRLPAVGSDPTADWQRQQLATLVAEVADLEVRVGSVEARLGTATTLAQTTLVEFAEPWRAACARVRATPAYRGLDLSPQLGLVPLGPDPGSGLEEFAHATSGALPRRDPTTGTLTLAEATSIVLVLVPGGRAVLGADREAPGEPRPANVDAKAPAEWTPSYVVELEPFFLSKYELTQAQWQRHTGQNPSAYQPGSGLVAIESMRHPVELVTWQQFARVLREFDLALPTEAQWEWAYRGGTSTAYPYGEDASALAGHENLADQFAREHGRNGKWRFLDWLNDGHTVHAPVGTFLPNAFGLHDMGGNVKEWCEDTWEDYPAVAPRAGDGLRQGQYDRYRIVRGGSYASSDDDPRSAARGGVEKTLSGPEAGVRPVRRIER